MVSFFLEAALGHCQVPSLCVWALTSPSYYRFTLALLKLISAITKQREAVRSRRCSGGSQVGTAALPAGSQRLASSGPLASARLASLAARLRAMLRKTCCRAHRGRWRPGRAGANQRAWRLLWFSKPLGNYNTCPLKASPASPARPTLCYLDAVILVTQWESLFIFFLCVCVRERDSSTDMPGQTFSLWLK